MKRIITSGTTALTLLLSTTAPVLAQAGGPVRISIEPPQQVLPGGSLNANQVITFVLWGLVAVGVIAALIWLILGAIRWITSGGDKGKVDAARGQIVAAIIGLVIIILSLVILNVVASILGVGNLFNLCIPTLGNTAQCQ